MKVVGRITYKRGKLIGEGHFSKVYMAEDTQLSGTFAAKEIPKADFPNPDEYFNEAGRMHAASCPNVVPIRLACVTKSHVSLLMPLFSKGSLGDLIKKDGPLRLLDTLRIGDDILKGLSQIHGVDILHLDLKPSNVLFGNNGQALVADFGQSRRVGTSGVTVAPEMYTPATPPEVILTGDVTVMTDLYQAGLVLYRCLIGDADYESQLAPFLGHRDFSRLNDAIVRGKFPDRDRLGLHVPRKLKTVIRKAMAIDPSDRYSTALQMIDDLANVKPSLDWGLRLAPSGDCRWKACRLNQPSFVVDLTKNGVGWDVSVFTEANGKMRRRPNTPGCSKATAADARKHLKDVFAALG